MSQFYPEKLQPKRQFFKKTNREIYSLYPDCCYQTSDSKHGKEKLLLNCVCAARKTIRTTNFLSFCERSIHVSNC